VRLADPLVELPVVPDAAVVVVAVVVDPGDAELDPHAETARTIMNARARSPSAFAAFLRVRCLFSVMEQALPPRMIGT
jgi:hypothetical protein